MQELRDNIKKYKEETSKIDLDLIESTYVERGQSGDLREFIPEIKNIKIWLDLFSEIDFNKFLPHSLEEINFCFRQYNELIFSRIRTFLKNSTITKQSIKERILNIEEKINEISNKYKNKLGQNLLNKSFDLSKKTEEILEQNDKISKKLENISKKTDDDASKIFSYKFAEDFQTTAIKHRSSMTVWFIFLFFISAGIIIFSLSEFLDSPLGNFQDNYFRIVPIYVILGSLFVLFYLLFKNSREKYIEQSENSLIFDNLRDFIHDKNEVERIIIINIVLSRLKKDKTKEVSLNSDIVKMVLERVDAFRK